MKEQVVPKFRSEAAEAKWWDERAVATEATLAKAIRAGMAAKDTARKLSRQTREAVNITIRMPLDDLARARALAEQKGLGYQTYMKMLLHEALLKAEKRAS